MDDDVLPNETFFARFSKSQDEPVNDIDTYISLIREINVG